MNRNRVKDKHVGALGDEGKTAAYLYEVKPYYERFNQKNHMTRQPLWNPPAIELDKKRNKSLSKLIRSNHKGYRLQDRAFSVGASANMANCGFSRNWPNRKGNSWQPLTKQDYKAYGKLEAHPAAASQIVRKASLLFGADHVGFCRLDRRWVYSHWFDVETKQAYPIKFSDDPGYEIYREPIQHEDKTQVIPKEMKYVIVLLYEMDEKGMATAPTLTQMATTQTAYSRISFTTISMAEFVRGLGYNAIPCANDTALSVPLAVDAGLGELGRNAKLITTRFGPRCRISKVITDLPLEVGRARTWGVTEFCNACRKCAKLCPAQAIPLGERSFEPLEAFNQNGVLQWQVDHMKCFKYMSKVGTNCGLCIRVCPFNKPKGWIHDFVRFGIKRRIGILDSLIVWFDDLLGYGRSMDPDHFWGQ